MQAASRRGCALAGGLAAAAFAVALPAAPAGAHPSHGRARAAQTPAGNSLDGRTTLEATLRAREAGVPFRFLSLGPGEPHIVRQDGVGRAQAGRDRRRRSLVYFGQLTDFQVSDEESPSRVEPVDTAANPSLADVLTGGWRPQEALVAHGVDLAIRNMNRFLDSPHPQGDGRRARMAFALMTGDLADNQQFNETEWVRILLEGGTLDPNSGSTDPAHYAGCPSGTPGPDEAPRYTGVQDYDDYVEGTQFYDPDQPAGPWAAWPRYPGLMDRAQARFEAEGVKVPSYVTFGNHDGLVQGNAAAVKPHEDVGVGCVKPVGPAPVPTQPQSLLDPGYLSGLLQSDPDKVMLVPPDPRRRFVDKAQFKEIYAAGRQPDDHGFAYVDPKENAASSGAAAYYVFDPVPGFRFISIDTLSEAGVAGPSSEGNIDDPQWRWLERELEKAEDGNKVIVLFGHHPVRSLYIPIPDEMAPPCTTVDGHGHDANPGCDRDPRSSSPIHSGTELAELLKAHPHVIAYVAGHTHENKVTPFPREGGGGFWGIETPSIVDWPPQTRVIEVMDNRDGTLSIFGTVLDTAAPPTSPPSGTDAGRLDVATLASIGRTLAFNDPQAGGGRHEGRPEDRNVELLVADPRRPQTAADKPKRRRPAAERKPKRRRAPARRRATTRRELGAAAPATGGAGAGGGGLPFTGFALVPIAGLGLLLVGGGVALRRRSPGRGREAG